MSCETMPETSIFYYYIILYHYFSLRVPLSLSSRLPVFVSAVSAVKVFSRSFLLILYLTPKTSCLSICSDIMSWHEVRHGPTHSGCNRRRAGRLAGALGPRLGDHSAAHRGDLRARRGIGVCHGAEAARAARGQGVRAARP